MTAPETPGHPLPPAPQDPPSSARQLGLEAPHAGQAYPSGDDAGQRSESGPLGSSGPALKKPLQKAVLFGGAGLILGIFLGIIGTTTVTAAVNNANAKAAAEAEANKPRPLPEAVAKCKLTSDGTTAKLGDDGHSLSLDNKGKDDYAGLTMAQIDCVLEALNMPDSIYDQMGNTRALDGTQRDSWDAFSVSWNYHPDSGLNVNIKESAS